VAQVEVVSLDLHTQWCEECSNKEQMHATTCTLALAAVMYRTVDWMQLTAFHHENNKVENCTDSHWELTEIFFWLFSETIWYRDK